MTMFPGSDIGHHVDIKAGVVPAAAAAGTVNGTGFDRTDYESASLFVGTGAATGTPTSFTVNAKIQHSDDDGDADAYADATDVNGDALAITAITAINTVEKQSFSLMNLKKYIRVVVVTAFVGGSTPTICRHATIVLGGSRKVPTTD